MIDIPRGLLVTGICIVLGSVPLTLLLHLISLPPKLAGVAVIVYAAAGGVAISEYAARHPDEFQDR